MVAPTIQWVPEMGSFKKEATSCHTAEPENTSSSIKTKGRIPVMYAADITEGTAQQVSEIEEAIDLCGERGE